MVVTVVVVVTIVFVGAVVVDVIVFLWPRL
jgi:hypothetical protein